VEDTEGLDTGRYRSHRLIVVEVGILILVGRRLVGCAVMRSRGNVRLLVLPRTCFRSQVDSTTV